MKAERCNVLEQRNIGERGYSLSDFKDINGTDIKLQSAFIYFMGQ